MLWKRLPIKATNHDQSKHSIDCLGYILIGNFVVGFMQSLFRGDCEMREHMAIVLVWPYVIVLMIGEWLGEVVRRSIWRQAVKKETQIPDGTIGWYAGFNLAGIYYQKPVRVVYRIAEDQNEEGYWVATSKKFDLYEKVSLGITARERRVVFVSTNRYETELFIAGMSAVVDVARESLFWQKGE
jgi:hypothetical protein